PLLTSPTRPPPKPPAPGGTPGKTKRPAKPTPPPTSRARPPAGPTPSTACPSTAAPTPKVTGRTAPRCPTGWAPPPPPPNTTPPARTAPLRVPPPLGSPIAVHSAVPLPGRDIVVINSEALRENCDEPAGYAATVDITDESDPILMAVFPPPRPPKGYDAPSFCAKGGRAGPHNQHQQQGLACLAP